jgi:hypothetical protein
MLDELTKKKKRKKAHLKKIEKMKGQIAEHQHLLEIVLENLSGISEGQEMDSVLEFVTASTHAKPNGQEGETQPDDQDRNRPGDGLRR